MIIRRRIKITSNIVFNDRSIPSSGIVSVVMDLVVEVVSSSLGNLGECVGVVGEVGVGVVG